MNQEITSEMIDKIAAEVGELVANDKYNFQKCATRMDRNGPYCIEDVVAAILASKGVLVAAANLLGRRRQRLREYIYRNPVVLEFFDDYFEGNLDRIERNVIDEALNGDMKSAQFMLVQRGKKRGYGTGVTSPAGNNLTMPFSGFTLTVAPGHPAPELSLDDGEETEE